MMCELMLEIDGMPVFIYDEVSSTMDIALEHFMAVDYEFAVFAASQTKGVGRNMSYWSSPKGNIYLSIVKKLPSNINNISSLSLVASIAVGDLVQKFSNLDISYKWPNDVMVNGKKIAGILLQMVENFVVIGIGINILSAPSDASMLGSTGAGLDSMCRSLVLLLNSRYNEWLLHGFIFLRELWMQRAMGLNKMVYVSDYQECIGCFVGINDCGAMLVKKNGVVNSYLSAEKVRVY
ncbi:BirA family transcriptional regulator, biotin operon repressor / biotin---(acetyl-CoA-carboxylase) ligase [Candidatus Xenohaliotis californiensis]|uniref:BirA family transcriptional regulator, biotin operon repressor / biotin---(Acetyl-CoA-carboxylase) ligase n=1 Tax=Candidatus Xenohaliotis californiensis TaxID=84677 RepID=A0ABP0ET81_9RICK|nr:BirA family transcriptional regulator, biotin operon repressor / biotin---(acetyl-CoA-carboxylase) ligase [Candidatus Xenohaliotis californiensis]